MKLLQYLILTILIANGSMPLVQDIALSTGNEQLISFFGSDTVTDDQQESDSEDVSDDDLVDSEKNHSVEPKPYDNTTKNSPAKGSFVHFTSSTAYNYSLGDWVILSENSSVHITSSLLRQCYYSKSPSGLYS